MATFLVTGANRGIGLELVKQISARRDTAIAACRTASSALRALGVRVETGVDVTSDEAVSDMARGLRDTRIDVVVHAAGILVRDTLENLELETVLEQLQVNALGPLRTTRALIPLLGRGSKVAILTSRMGSIGDNTSGGYYGYRMSKAALNMAAVSLAHDLRPRGIAVALLHPGYVRTDMTGGQGNVDPPEAVRGLLARIDALTLETSGGFWHANGERLPW